MLDILYCTGQVNEGRMPGNANDSLHSGVGGAPRSVTLGLGTLKRCKTCAEHTRALSWGYRAGVAFQRPTSRRRGEVSSRFQGAHAEDTQVIQHLEPLLPAPSSL